MNCVINFAAGPKPLALVSFGECHTEAPYVIAGRTTAVYTCLSLLNVAPHVEAVTLAMIYQSYDVSLIFNDAIWHFGDMI